jgi:ABC-type nitrate/sulfonate/bicarbonate transport system ATPase subunit
VLPTPLALARGIPRKEGREGELVIEAGGLARTSASSSPQVPALREINLIITRPEIDAAGHSGCGKITLSHGTSGLEHFKASHLLGDQGLARDLQR